MALRDGLPVAGVRPPLARALKLGTG